MPCVDGSAPAPVCGGDDCVGVDDCVGATGGVTWGVTCGVTTGVLLLHDCVESGCTLYVVASVSCLLWERPFPCPWAGPDTAVLATTLNPHGAVGATDCVGWHADAS